MSSIIEPAKTMQVLQCLRKLKEIGFSSEQDWQRGLSLLKWSRPGGAPFWNSKQTWLAFHIINRHKDKLTAAGLEVPPDPGIVSTHSRSERNYYDKGSAK